MAMKHPIRRLILGALAAAACAGLAAPSFSGEGPRVTVHRNATCGCCKKWAEHLRNAGFTVNVVDEADMAGVKNRLGVPSALASCHTAEVGGYVVEGHAPAAAIKKLLAEKPNAKGIAVPGMPGGSPGMEGAGEADAYEVTAFGAGGQKSFAKFKGAKQM